MTNYIVSALLTAIIVLIWHGIASLIDVPWYELGLVAVTFSFVLRIPYKRD